MGEGDFTLCAGGGDPVMKDTHEFDQRAWEAYLLLEEVPWFKVIALAEPRGPGRFDWMWSASSRAARRSTSTILRVASLISTIGSTS